MNPSSSWYGFTRIKNLIRIHSDWFWTVFYHRMRYKMFFTLRIFSTSVNSILIIWYWYFNILVKISEWNPIWANQRSFELFRSLLWNGSKPIRNFFCISFDEKQSFQVDSRHKFERIQARVETDWRGLITWFGFIRIDFLDWFWTVFYQMRYKMFFGLDRKQFWEWFGFVRIELLFVTSIRSDTSYLDTIYVNQLDSYNTNGYIKRFTIFDFILSERIRPLNSCT